MKGWCKKTNVGGQISLPKYIYFEIFVIVLVLLRLRMRTDEVYPIIASSLQVNASIKDTIFQIYILQIPFSANPPHPELSLSICWMKTLETQFRPGYFNNWASSLFLHTIWGLIYTLALWRRLPNIPRKCKHQTAKNFFIFPSNYFSIFV